MGSIWSVAVILGPIILLLAAIYVWARNRQSSDRSAERFGCGDGCCVAEAGEEGLRRGQRDDSGLVILLHGTSETQQVLHLEAEVLIPRKGMKERLLPVGREFVLHELVQHLRITHCVLFSSFLCIEFQ